jgi:hypothetical protein
VDYEAVARSCESLPAYHEHECILTLRKNEGSSKDRRGRAQQYQTRDPRRSTPASLQDAAPMSWNPEPPLDESAQLSREQENDREYESRSQRGQTEFHSYKPNRVPAAGNCAYVVDPDIFWTNAEAAQEYVVSRL